MLCLMILERQRGLWPQIREGDKLEKRIPIAMSKEFLLLVQSWGMTEEEV